MDEGTVALIASIVSIVSVLLLWQQVRQEKEGVLLLWQQVRQEKRSQKRSWFSIFYEMLANHKHIIEALKDPNWTPVRTAANSEINEDGLRAYMGLFEGTFVLVDSGIVELELFERLHGIRVRQVILNKHAFEILKKQPYGWQDFIRLCKNIAEIKVRQGVKEESTGTGDATLAEAGDANDEHGVKEESTGTGDATSPLRTNEEKWNDFIKRVDTLEPK